MANGTSKQTPKVTLERIMAALEDGDDYPGFCLGCGAEAFGIDPDARGDACGAHRVYGAEECLLMEVA